MKKDTCESKMKNGQWLNTCTNDFLKTAIAIVYSALSIHKLVMY